MEHYVGLDVSLKLTAICIVDRTGKIEREGVVTSDPETIAAFVKSHAPHVARIGLEAGATSTWLWTELDKMGLPVICIDARHAKAALKMQINKSDRNDAVGIARIMQCGWYKEVRVNAVVHLKTVVPQEATVPIGWIAVGDPARILSPDQHDAIWAIQKPLDFPATAYGLNRSPDGSVDMHELTSRLSESARRHRPEEP